MSLVQPPTLTHQQPCVVVSLASTNLAWSDKTALQLRPLHLLLPDCICFSYCSPIESVSVAAPQLHPLQLLLLEYIHLLSRTCSTKYNNYEGRTSLPVL